VVEATGAAVLLSLPPERATTPIPAATTRSNATPMDAHKRFRRRRRCWVRDETPESAIRREAYRAANRTRG
jgi:hypothetical protein